MVKTVGSLQLMKNQFGYCVRGRLMSGKHSRDYTGACVTINHVSATVNAGEIDISELPDLKVSLDKVFGSNLDLANERCVCKQDISSGYTIREKRELDLIEQGLVYDEVDEVWVAKYPWIRDPMDFT